MQSHNLSRRSKIRTKICCNLRNPWQVQNSTVSTRLLVDWTLSRNLNVFPWRVSIKERHKKWCKKNTMKLLHQLESHQLSLYSSQRMRKINNNHWSQTVPKHLSSVVLTDITKDRLAKNSKKCSKSCIRINSGDVACKSREAIRI